MKAIATTSTPTTNSDPWLDLVATMTSTYLPIETEHYNFEAHTWMRLD